MFGRNRAVPFGYEIMHSSADALAIGLLPFAAHRAGRCDHVKVNVAIAQMAKANGPRAGELLLYQRRSRTDEVGHPFHRHGNVVLHGRAMRAFCRRYRIP